MNAEGSSDLPEKFQTDYGAHKWRGGFSQLCDITSPGLRLSATSAAMATASSYWAFGTNIRDSALQDWPLKVIFSRFSCVILVGTWEIEQAKAHKSRK